MRTAKFLSPLHPSKVCDIVLESISTLYNTSGEIYHSDIFANITNHIITVSGTIVAHNHFTDDEIISHVKLNLDNDVSINLNISKLQPQLELQPRVFSGTFLGYANSENEFNLPFEYVTAKELTKLIFLQYKIPISVQVNINGITNKIYLEHNSDNNQEIDEIVHDYISGTDVTIIHDNLDLNRPFGSDNYTIQNLYGPRTPYGDVNFVGKEIITNKRLAHIISRKLALNVLKKHRLAYCMVELSYAHNNSIPFQIGIKGNETGIFLENGTFFIHASPADYSTIETSIINDMNMGALDIIEMARWGIK